MAKDTKPHVLKAFGSGASFGAAAFTLLGIATAFTGGTVLGFGNPIIGIMAAGGLGMVTFGPLSAAANVIVHTIPGLSSLTGLEHTGHKPEKNKTQIIDSNLSASEEEDLQFVRESEKKLFVTDYVQDKSYAQQIEAERAIEEMESQQAGMKQGY